MKFSDAAMQEAAGGTEPYFFEVVDYKDQVKRIAMAYIPKGILARKEMDNWIIPKRQRETMATERMEHTEKTLAVTGSTEMCFVEDTRYYVYNSSGELLHTIIVGHYEPCATATPDGGGDGSGGGGWGWPGDDYEDGQICPDGCEDSGGGGTSQPDVDPCDEPNPPVWCTNKCETGDEIIDNTAVQETFEYLITKSELNLNIDQRTEQGGFIVQDPASGDLSFVEFPNEWLKFACGIALPNNWLNAVPSNTIAHIHTHPFFEGEDTTSPNVCGADGDDNYESGTNIDDIEVLNYISQHLSNYAIKGYVLDGSNITSYSVLEGLIDQDQRCGY